VAAGELPTQALLALLALPIAIGGIRTALRSYDDIPNLTPAKRGDHWRASGDGIAAHDRDRMGRRLG